jgi:hypothetical protein
MERHSLLLLSEYAHGFDHLGVRVWQVLEEWTLSRRRTVQVEWLNRGREPLTIISYTSQIASAWILYTVKIISFVLVDCLSFLG